MNFSELTPLPLDPIIEVFEDFLHSDNPKKVNLSIGLYFDEEGQIYQFDSVRQASEELSNLKKVKSYLPIEGSPAFCRAIEELVFGKDNEVVVNNRLATVQTLAATSGLRVVADFAYRDLGCRRMFVTNPTWSNHIDIFKEAGFEVTSYQHYDHEIMGVNFDKVYAELSERLQPKDLILLHPICHNPTGADFTNEQWDKLNQLFKEKDTLVVYDMAYLGYGNGIESDAYAVRSAARILEQFVTIFSCSKSFSMYADRTGAVSILCKDANQAKIVRSNLSVIIRSSYSTPIAYGAHMVTKLLTEPELRQQWESELEVARLRLIENRKLLVDGLKANGVEGLDYILKQHGFFSFLPVTPEQVIKLRKEYAVYIIKSGRLNFAGISKKNVDYIAYALAQILKA